MGFPWTPVNGPQEASLLGAMKSDRFEVMGSMRTYWDFYVGFGLAITGFLALQAVVLWQLALLAKRELTEVRPFIVVFFVSFLMNAILTWKYFFFPPFAMAVAICACLAVAFHLTRPQVTASTKLPA
jgi:hypothetical protein